MPSEQKPRPRSSESKREDSKAPKEERKKDRSKPSRNSSQGNPYGIDRWLDEKQGGLKGDEPYLAGYYWKERK
ncbi:hypothetical protein LTR09_005029 [Extremus antarcticus]|uniref:Uncharacterized protein n=1 Tax=Extremus antarcticus TaxID=702011 RepID=A0AAJ0DGN4_9PEZI|nr:hypothetical protein LTR09_005029 [Extremus antarcticus]